MSRTSPHRTPSTVRAGHCSRARMCSLAATLPVLVFSSSPGAAQSTLYVDASATGAANGSSWCDAFVQLQNALAAALASGGLVTEILIAEGVYRPDRGAGQTLGDRTATFGLIDAVALRGGYAGCSAPDPDARDIQLYVTALSGDLLGNDDPSESSPAARHSVTTAITCSPVATPATAPWKG